MKKLLVALLAALAPLGALAPAQAGSYSLSLSSPADVNHLTVGQSVTFDVNLSGVDPAVMGTFLSYLAATVEYDSTLLGPSTVIAGAIVLDADPANFTGTGFPSLTNKADAFYDSSFPDPLSAPIFESGTFFSFTVMTLAAGDGTISFESAAATLATDPIQTDQFTPDTSSLSFHIETSAVPEPSSHVLLLSAALVGVVAALTRRRRRQRPRAGGPGRFQTTH
jgi:hypothetical protein